MDLYLAVMENFFLGLNEHSQSITKIKHLPQLLTSMPRKCSSSEKGDHHAWFTAPLQLV